MIDNLIFFSIKNKLIIGLFTIALIVWGIFSLRHLPIDAVPDITNNQVQIITMAPTLSAQETEQFITATLEMNLQTIPDIVELRSISRFGLSVITVVFEDKVDIYKARQLVSERLREAETQIPKGFGTPELSPVTTGLGEIYQYIIHPKKGSESKYSSMELRTIQDWIVRRQLLGTPGVADVSSFGGHLKQYEVAVNPARLKSMNVSLAEIFTALEKNNENTGGAYIEKKPNAYFIRGIGLALSIDDLEKTVIRTNAAVIPLLIRDVAEVGYGSAVRYGAMTRNDEGEVVGGLVLMLKGANSAQVIDVVKQRIEQIKKSLPEGVEIEPFLDRTKLVNKAMGTVSRNLIEGGLIVIFILVLLLGNLRAGLVVASVIPLAMLFAISMMNLFGISGNLMSLGANDFGLIVDGAVIIVESIVHRITTANRGGPLVLTAEQMDGEVFHASSRIRKSAAFGEIIILIVYIPILTLIGVEGKMFRPMAQTVGFAVLGALILSLTYVPMMSALVLSKKTEHKKNISDRIMEFFHRLYTPVIEFSLRQKTAVITASVIIFVGALILFLRMGGEFIPTLEEGDFAVETRLMQGASLTQTIETTLQAGGIIKKQFPEVIEVVGKIGTSEIPTDPMPINSCDLMIILKDKHEWTSASTREELEEKMGAALSVIPGVEFGFQQPIQMRFNELMTGVRQDVAVKIFGEDMETLSAQAEQVAKIAKTVEGTEDIYTETVSGLPQVQVRYNRDKLSQYGLSVAEVNDLLATAFAGKVAGVIFEGEKRFDLVVRMNKDFRQSIEDVRDLNVTLPSGNQVSIEQIADVEFQEGPTQVSRENANRRIYVGFNVRGRDVESVVEEIQRRLDKELKLPPGYYITYGGQFENLQAAKERLSIVLPAALLLIFILLFFTFRSVKQSLLILTAIPLSAIGGVVALWLRDMPFSISAGVGFIALFGIAVLNGIVLIAEFNRLKEEGITDLYERVRKGTSTRLRPVIMTAAVASLGFLPMALSTSEGAEVQKPLATVVIGGLITATMLTLVVLPILYIISTRKKRIGGAPVGAAILIGVFFLIANTSSAQDARRTLKLTDAIAIALQQNPQAKSASLQIEQQQVLTKTAIDLPKTNLSLTHGQYNSSFADTYLEVTQELSFPTVYLKQRQLQDATIRLSEQNLVVTKNEIARSVSAAYYQALYYDQLQQLAQYQDSVYQKFVSAATLRYKTGESANLELLAAKNKYKELQIRKKEVESEAALARKEVQKLLNDDYEVFPSQDAQKKLTPFGDKDTSSLINNSLLNYYRQKVEVADEKSSLEKHRFLPDLSLGYFSRSLDGVGGFHGVKFGVSLPIFFWTQQGKVQAADLETRIAEEDLNQYNASLSVAFERQWKEYQSVAEALSYYETEGLSEADEMLRTATVAFGVGEIGYVEYSYYLSEAISIKTRYYQILNQFNQTVIHLTYLTEGK